MSWLAGILVCKDAEKATKFIALGDVNIWTRERDTTANGTVSEKARYESVIRDKGRLGMRASPGTVAASVDGGVHFVPGTSLSSLNLLSLVSAQHKLLNECE